MPVDRSDFSQTPSRKESERDWMDAIPSTPAFVYDETRLSANLAQLDRIRAHAGCELLYSIKAFPFTGLLKRLRGRVDGFSVSSLFEARLAHEVLAGEGSLHITTPGFRPQEMAEIGGLCDYLNFNSLNQLNRLAAEVGGKTAVGLRINPQLSFLDDPRYDPCRQYSKLGAPLSEVATSLQSGGMAAISGLHFHSNFGATSLHPLQQTVRHIESRLPRLVRDIDWINMGGGYLFRDENDIEKLHRLIDHINASWGARVFLEPGKAVIENAAFLVASVIDTFVSDGRRIAVLDTSVNHLPEVFEYQTRPALLDEAPGAPHKVTLAGATCLSGDLFGEYAFPRPLEIGDRVAFRDVGAYSLIKASRFNGHNLPSIHLRDGNGGMSLLKAYGYDDYRSQWSEGAQPQPSLRSGTA